ncbi:MAG: hypothetical protein G01um10148_1061 [Parcubacteria group bacterium Gr01-1014_8]|nr:MAG: hypothetical protein G01um10148_1061 [Parcubacteria group bacterium Gr01-1014_8]
MNGLDSPTGDRNSHPDPVIRQLIEQANRIEALVQERMSGMGGMSAMWQSPVAFQRVNQFAPASAASLRGQLNTPTRPESALADIATLKRVVGEQQAWIDAQPVRKHIKEGLELLKKEPTTWGRILQNTLLVASGITYTALASKHLTSGFSLAMLTGLGIPAAIAASAIVAVLPALAITGLRARRAIREASDLLKQKYGQGGKDVIVEGKGWRFLRMTGRSATIDVVVAALLVGGLMEMKMPWLGPDTSPADVVRQTAETVWKGAGNAISTLWGLIMRRTP